MRQSYLEMVIANLLCVLIPIPKAERQISQSLIAGMELRNKIEALKGIGMVRRPNKAWYKRLDKILDTIGNEYAPKRNRFAHDVWMIDTTTNEARRIQFKVDVPKQPRDGENDFTTERDVGMVLSEMYELADAMDRAGVELDRLRQEFVAANPKWP